MSANHSLILFAGDMTSLLPSLFACFGYRTTGTVEIAKGLPQIWEYTNWPRRSRPYNVVHKAVLYNGTWTAILDREMTMILDQEKCTKCASQFNIKIFGYMVESVSGTCAFYLYSPEKVRGLNIQNFEILENFGEPLPQEAGITTEEMLVDGTMRISRRLGFSDSLFAHPTSKVQIFGMEDPARTQTHQQTTAPTHKQNKHTNKHPPITEPIHRIEKPWWKLW
ncbi:MAG: hypothetical protein LBE12_18645 [Planctomycetaceae bacterium]|jgi:hypothetical protein|nr:hypothetical protein [Planctomycetaceae bacterium]